MSPIGAMWGWCFLFSSLGLMFILFFKPPVGMKYLILAMHVNSVSTVTLIAFDHCYFCLSFLRWHPP